MADARVTCIRKIDRYSTVKGITHLGGAEWVWTRQEVIASIQNGTNTFFTFVDDKRADIKVVNDPNGAYVQTYADGRESNNLLSLPRVPLA